MRFNNTFRDQKDFNFEVRRERLTLASGVDTGLDALVREDTGKFLSPVSPKYRVTTHKEANAFAESLLSEAGLEWDEGHISVNEKGTRFMREFRFSDKSFIPGAVESTALDYEGTDDTFVPTLLLRNSYDKSSTLDFTFGAFRMVCSNGMIVPHTVVQKMRVKHTERPNFSKIGDTLIDRLEQTVDGFKGMYDRLNGETANPYLQMLIQQNVLNAAMATVLQNVSRGLINFEIEDQQILNATASPQASAYMLMNLMTELATHRLKKYSRSVDMQRRIAGVFQ